MASTEIERHQGNTLALTDEHYLSRIPQLAEQLARSTMCPEQFKGKPDEIAIVGYSLADNGIRLSINTLPQCYVVHNRPGYMAQIQTAMAAMHGYDIHPVGSKCDEQSATVEVVTPKGERHQVTFTMAEARRAGLDKNPGQMYHKWATNMLVARATTRAIGWYCPQVKLGLAGTVNVDELAAVEAAAGTPVDADPATGEIVDAARPMRDAPDGATIPEALREPAIDPIERQALLDRLVELDASQPDVVARVRDEARELAIPNLRSNRVTRAHGALLRRLLDEALEAAEPVDGEVVGEEPPADLGPDGAPF